VTVDVDSVAALGQHVDQGADRAGEALGDQLGQRHDVAGFIESPHG
jgi:hypothetical protein